MKSGLDRHEKRMTLRLEFYDKEADPKNRACLSSSLEFYYISCFGTLGSIDNFKTHRLTFGKGLESLVLNVSIVHKHVSAVFLIDKSEALGIIEPLNGSVRHDDIPSFLVFEDYAEASHKKNRKEKVFAAVNNKDFRIFIRISISHNLKEGKAYCHTPLPAINIHTKAHAYNRGLR